MEVTTQPRTACWVVLRVVALIGFQVLATRSRTECAQAVPENLRKFSKSAEARVGGKAQGGLTRERVGALTTGRTLQKSAASHADAYFRPSLETMEAQEFLLIPAVLAMESISDGQIVTYPHSSEIITASVLSAFTNIFKPEIGMEPQNGIHPSIQFNAVLHFCQPRRRPVDIYTRYWVSGGEYQIQILWVEPNVFESGLGTYAPGLLVRSGTTNFLTRQDALGTSDATSKFLGPRPVFRHMLGQCPIADLRYSDSEMLAGLILERNLAPSELANRLRSRAALGGIHKSNMSELFPGSPVEAHLTLLNSRYEEVERLTYTFQPEHKNELVQLTALLPAGEIVAGFYGAGIKVWDKEVTNQFKDLPLPRMQGGRIAQVDYGSLALNGGACSIPNAVKVTTANDLKLLMSAILTNVVGYPAQTGSSEIFAHERRNLEPEFKEYFSLIRKYHGAKLSAVSAEDNRRIYALAHFFQNHDQKDNWSESDNVRRLSISLDLLLMLREPKGLEDAFKSFLSSLVAVGSVGLLTDAGYCVINKALVSECFAEADRLLPLWTEAVDKNTGMAEIQAFILARGSDDHLWANAQLLNCLLRNHGISPNESFNLAVKRSVALTKLKRVCLRGTASPNRNSRIQAAWMLNSLPREALGRIIVDSITEVDEAFQKLPSPSSAEQQIKLSIHQSIAD